MKAKATSKALDGLEAETRERLLADRLPAATIGLNVVASEKFKQAWTASGMKGLKFIKPLGLKCGRKTAVNYFLLWPEAWLSMGDDVAGIDADVAAVMREQKIPKDIGNLIGRNLTRTVVTKESVNKHEPFDVATTDHCSPDPGILIGSHRFHDFCPDMGAEIRWEPVDIER